MKKLIILISIIIALLITATLWWKIGESPKDPNNKNSVIFVVKKGAGIREIINSLKEKGLIRSRIVFFLLVKQLGIDKEIEAGDFRISPSMTAQEIAKNLTHGTLDIWITIPEGKRTEEVAEILKNKMPFYKESWRYALLTNEGYLFPDTYLISKDADIEMIIKQMKDNFEKKYTTLKTNNSKLSKREIVILASIIEREAITDQEKPIIAGILMNRLEREIALQVDATIQYAKGQNPKTQKWWDPVTIEEYKSIKSPYNTYLFLGLPPQPISNPGLETLKAAATPAITSYMYYLHDKNRIIRYAKTIQEHSNNINKYGL